MPLIVYTARISSRDPDRLDVTRKSAGPEGLPFAPSADLLRAGKSARVTFAEYDRRYVEEMRRSWLEHRGAWLAVLARPRVVLCCYCTNPAECHRSLLAGLLAKCGAEVRGEVGLEAAIGQIVAGEKATGRLTPRMIVEACEAHGAEACVVWATLEARGVIERGSYEVAKDKGLLKALAKRRRELSTEPGKLLR